MLFLLRYFKPVLEQNDSLADQKTLEGGTIPKKLLVLLLCTKAHHVFHSGTVIPAPVEDDDFASGGELFDIALRMELRFLPLRRSRKGYHAKDARTHAIFDLPLTAERLTSISGVDFDFLSFSDFLLIVFGFPRC